jgi:hypothetical protein
MIDVRTFLTCILNHALAGWRTAAVVARNRGLPVQVRLLRRKSGSSEACFNGAILLKDGSVMTFSEQFIGLALLASSGVAAAQTTLATCRLGQAQNEVVSVIAEQPIADSRQISLKAASEGRPNPIFGNEDDAFRGAEIKVRCVGKKEKVLIVIGEFLGAGYPRGVAVRFHQGALERLEFAEPGLPVFVDLTPSDMSLVFSRHGPEIAAPFAIYRYLSGTGPMPGVVGVRHVALPASGVRIPVQP